MSLQEKGFVISIQHLQSHRGILGHARILFSCPKGYKTQSCHWWGIVNRKHLGLFLNLANSSTGIYQTKGSDMGMGQNWTPCQWRGQWWPKTYQHSYFVACQRPPLQFAPNWPDPGHGTAQEAHLHSQALQFPDLTMNSSFFFFNPGDSEWMGRIIPFIRFKMGDPPLPRLGGTPNLCAENLFPHPLWEGTKVGYSGGPTSKLLCPKATGSMLWKTWGSLKS